MRRSHKRVTSNEQSVPYQCNLKLPKGGSKKLMQESLIAVHKSHRRTVIERVARTGGKISKS